MFRKTREENYQIQAITDLEDALAYWKLYANLASKQYLPQRFARTRFTDWHAIESEVKYDIDIAKEPL